MQYPAVVLDHSALVSTIACTGNSMSVAFTTDGAFRAAQTNWTIESFVAITSDDGCASTTGQHDYVLVDNVVFSLGNLSATLSITYINFTQAVGEQNSVTIDLGNFALSTGNGSTGFSTGTSGPVTNRVSRSTVNDDPTYPSPGSSGDFDIAL